MKSQPSSTWSTIATAVIVPRMRIFPPHRRPWWRRREILLAPPVLCVCAQEGRTDCAPAATPWTCAASHPARPSCLAAYPRSAAPALREFCALLECVYCVCPGLGKALQEALDELKSVALPLHSPCVGPCTG